MSPATKKILLTGGTGRLGSELQAILPGIQCPPRNQLDIQSPDSVKKALDLHQPEIFFHGAAYTDVAGAEQDRTACWKANVEGTRNVVRALQGTAVRLVHISTDYVFYGDRGDYREDDPVGPVRNHYALSKLTGEEVARVHSPHLVIRTSFRPREWPYPMAFTDVFTSQDYVDVIAPQIALAITHAKEIPFDTLHIATERKSVFELARRRKPHVKPGSRKDVSVDLPEDISLNIERWKAVRKAFGPGAL